MEDEFEKIITEEIARDPANAAKVAASRIVEIVREAIDDAVRRHFGTYPLGTCTEFLRSQRKFPTSQGGQ